MRTKKEAVNLANHLKNLCEKQIGGVWEMHVHENLGWHFSVSCGGIMIDRYNFIQNAQYASSLIGGTPVQVSIHLQTFDNPLDAYVAQISAIRSEIQRWKNTLAIASLGRHKLLSFEEWYDRNQADIKIEFAESGRDREMDFDEEKEFENRYEIYSNTIKELQIKDSQ